ncbi:MAG: tetratricopeptide repeat protein [Patescibacteria group bacterium]
MGKRSQHKKPMGLNPTDPESNSKSLRVLITNNKATIVFLVLFTTLIYLNSLNGQFVSDDIPSFRDYDLVRSIPKAFSFLMVQKALHAVSYSLFGLNPIPLHILSLISHILAVLLLFILTSLLFNKKTASFASFLFASHPVNTEAVAWISGFNYIANTIAFLLTAIFFTKFRQTNMNKYYIASLTIYILTAAFIRLPWLITTPFLLLILDFSLSHLKKQQISKTFLYQTLFFMTALLFTIFMKSSISDRIYYMQASPQTGFAYKPPYFINIPFIIFTQLKTLLFPLQLTLYYPNVTLTKFSFLAMILTTVAYPISALFIYIKNKLLGGVFLMIIASQIITYSPISLASSLADRYLYLATVPFSIFIAFLINKIGYKNKAAAYSICTIVIVLYSLRTVLRNSDWHSSETLAVSHAQINKQDYKVLSDLAQVYAEKKAYSQAIYYYEKARAINADIAEGRYNLGVVYYMLGRVTEAESEFRAAVKLNPNLSEASYNLAVIENDKGNTKEAIELLILSLKANPNSPKAKEALEVISSKEKLKEGN